MWLPSHVLSTLCLFDTNLIRILFWISEIKVVIFSLIDKKQIFTVGRIGMVLVAGVP